MNEMIHIGICDDNPIVAQELRNLVENVLKEKEIVYQIKIYLSGGELMEDVTDLDIVFLDIDLPEMDGIETGKQMRRKNDDCRLIMATGVPERFKEVFQIRPLRFVTKPFSVEEVAEALNAALQEELGMQTIEAYAGRYRYRILQKDIQCIRAFNGYTEITAKTKVFRKDVGIDYLHGELDERLFARISRSYLVNLAYVSDYGKGWVTLDGNTYRISRTRQTSFQSAYFEFDLKYRR